MSLQKLELIYGIWVVLSVLAIWFLARWAARRPLNGVLFALLVLIALVNLAQILYILAFGESIVTRPRSAFETWLQHTDYIWYPLFLLWPFAAAVGIAQTSLKILNGPALARWTAFGGSTLIAVLTPLIVIFVGCGLAGVCL